jgi:hypothetical protein
MPLSFRLARSSVTGAPHSLWRLIQKKDQDKYGLRNVIRLQELTLFHFNKSIRPAGTGASNQ